MGGTVIRSLDRQFDDLPKEVVFCRNCVVSNQRPRTEMNAHGICSACAWAYEKDHTVDWDRREVELAELCDRFRSTDGSYDIVVPGSGGKDSAFVAHQLKTRFGMHPLSCTWAPFDWTPIGWKNLKAFVTSGFNNLLAMPDGVLHRQLARTAFEAKGDAFEPFVYGQKAWAYHVAQRFDIRLIMYGENGELEYGGSTQYRDVPSESPSDWSQAYFKGASVDELVEHGMSHGLIHRELVTPASMQWYKPPPPEAIADRELEMHWYSYYQKWTPQENFYYAVTHTAFEPNDLGRTESTYTKHASLDDRADGFHFYLAYMKFGLGRCSRDAQSDIRRNHITRDEGVALVRRYDHEFPARHFRWFIDYLGITEEFFWQVMDFYRERSNVWEHHGGEWRLTAVVS
jgi:N-acetyl sugar amidotransferase